MTGKDVLVMSFPIRRYLALIFTVLLGIHNGFVALWLPDDEKPAVVFPYSARSLPAEDYQALQEGISIETPEELDRILEDFLS